MARKRGQPIHGWINLDKAKGISSAKAVAIVRRVFDAAKAGHGCTLDPAVTGVLPISVGQATRLLPYLPGDKTYRGVIQLGTSTSTDDLQGEVVAVRDWPRLSLEQMDQSLHPFRGSIEQCQPQV